MKRFYKQADVAPEGTAWRVTLDGRPIRTQGSRPQILPSAELAQVLAAEWAAQGEEIDPAGFVMRDLADYAIDIVAPDRGATIRELVPYADTDTLCYRAEPDEPLFSRQLEIWEPLLVAAEQRYDIHFTRISGIIPQPQPAPTLARMAAVLEALDDWQLAALKTLTSLAASLTIGLAALEPGADITALWDAANLEEDWQAELWGKDEMAAERRARRARDFAAAAQFVALSRAGSA